MASIYEALTTYLLAQSGLTALIDRRLFYDDLPAKLPGITAITISDIKEHLYGSQEKLETVNIQYTVFAETKLSAYAIAEQIKTALSEYHGTMSGITVQYIALINELPGIEKSADGTLKIYTHDLEYEVNFNKE